MMLSAEDQARIKDIAGRYGVKRVLLFGSCARDAKEPRDIDLAVEGLEPSLFFAAYGELIFGLSKPVDVVDLDQGGRFAEIIRREGVPVYG